jgi:diguanylate cyclase (GGDEF)-like protein/PAS domain S-box-containing protein
MNEGKGDFAAVFTNATVGMAIVGLDGRFQRVSNSFCRILGRTEEELAGHSFLDVTDPGDHDVGVDDLRRLVTGEIEMVQREKHYRSRTGEQAWVRMSAAAVTDASGVVRHLAMQIEDLTEQRRAEGRLEVSEARFRALFENSPVAIALVDLAGMVRSANLALSDLVGVALADLAGRPLRGLIGGLTKSDVTRAVRQRTVMIGERPFTHADGSSGWVLVAATRLEAIGNGSGNDATLAVRLIDITKLKVGEEALRQRGLHDELTGLPNRSLFNQRLNEALVDPRHAGRELAVVIVDLNHFKHVNDGLGHKLGDLVLAEAGRRIQAVTRNADTVARIGGDEFAVVAREVDDEVAALAIASNLRRRLCEPYRVTGNVVHVGASVGFALAPGDGQDAETLTQKADMALHRAKQLSGGIAAFCADDSAGFHRLGFVEVLRQAVANGSIDVAYQPVVDADGAVRGLEALARWHHPTRGDIPPDQFIPLAEQEHLIDNLTRVVLGRATTQHALWLARGVDIPTISVNVSAISLHSGSLSSIVDEALRASALPGERLTLEITEGTLADGLDPDVLGTIKRLRDLNVRLSIDDFGTGYSSLAYLKRLDFDELKIDRSFIADIDSDELSVPIVRSVIQLAHTLGLRVVAEGVETLEAERILRQLGCDLFQGYAICRPIHPSAVANFVTTTNANARMVGRSAASSVPHRRLTILAVDEDRAMRHALRISLQRLGHEVHEARSGSSALRLLKRLKPDVIVLDHILPGLSGVETVPLLRRAGHLGPIFLFSRLVPDLPKTVTLPLDVWPISKSDQKTLLEIIDAYATQPPATYGS